MKLRLLSTTALVGLGVIVSNPAFAVCDNNTPTSGQTVTCDATGGTDTVGINGTGQTGVFVQVTGGDVTVASGNAITLGGNANVNVGSFGSVNGQTGSGIVLEGAGSVSVASGSSINGTLGGVVYTGASASDIVNVAVAGLLDSVGFGQAAGTLTLYSGFTLGTADGGIGAGADTLTLDGPTNGSFDGDRIGISIVDFDTFVKGGSATWTITGTTKTNWTVSDGTLAADGDAVGDIAITNAGDTFQLTGGDMTTDISGAGGVLVDGVGISGNAQLSGNNTFTGAITVQNSSTLTLANSGAFQAVSQVSADLSTIAFGSAFTTDRNFVLGAQNATLDTGVNSNTISGAISGTGTLFKAGSGVLTLSGTNTYSGRTALIQGILAGTGVDNFGNGSSTNDFEFNGGTLRFDNGTNISDTRDIVMSGNGTINVVTDGDIYETSGGLSGGGDITKTGLGTLALTGIGNAAIDFTVSSGLLTGNAGNLLGNIVNNAFVEFNQTTDDTYAGTLTGTGIFIKSGVGNLTLAGTNTGYAGSINITNGTLIGDTTSLEGNIANNAALFFDQASDGTFEDVISGSGTLLKVGAGNLILTGTNTYTGATTVDTGRLSVNGSIAGSTTTVSSGGTVGGSGTLGSTIINNGGTFAPGNSIDQINVTGTLTFNAGSTLEIETTPTTSDRIDASGAVTINGGNVNVLAGGTAYAASTSYTIITGTSVTGTFTSVSDNLAFLDSALSYTTPGQVNLILSRNDIDFAEVAADDRQAGVANAVTESGAGSPLFTAFTSLSTTQAQDALEQLSGESIAGVASAVARSTEAVNNTVNTHLNMLAMQGVGGNAVALAAPADGTYSSALLQPGSGLNVSSGAWLQAIGSIGRTDASGTAPKQERDSAGLVGGIDMPTENGYTGIYGAYENGSIDTDSQNAESDVNNYTLGVYGSQQMQGFRLNGGLSGTYHDVETSRDVSFLGFTGNADGDTEGYTASTFLEASMPIANDHVALEPYAAVNLSYTSLDDYTESGAGAANLTVDDMDELNPSTTLGIRIGKSYDVNGNEGSLNLRANVGWQHNYGDLNESTTMRFAPGTASFNVEGAGRSRNAAVIGLGFDTQIWNQLSAYADYTGTLSSDDRDHGVTAGVKWHF